MDIPQEKIQELVEKYINKTASEAERKMLAEIMEQQSAQGNTMQMVGKIWANFKNNASLIEAEKSNEILNKILQQKPNGNSSETKIRKLKIWKRIAVAASFLLVVGSATWFFYLKNNKKPEPLQIAKETIAPPTEDIQPGKQGAILTLANGKKIVLDSLGNGQITGAAIKEGNKISYAEMTTGKQVEYNTMTTPNGRQYMLELADGTRVWLNAASSINFPTAFVGKDRKVEITGEAYFEVAKNAEMPFRVITNKEEIEVLGTHFNVNSYDNESEEKTTVLEGRVKVSILNLANSKMEGNSITNQTIASGQQAKIANNKITINNKADIEKVMAWKQGLFNFNDAKLKDVMRQLERWYDIKVVYEGEAPDISFWGEMSKDVTLNGLLIGLKSSKVHFRVEGRKLVVMR